MSAKYEHGRLYRELTTGETVAGWLYLPFYLFFLSSLLQLLLQKIGAPADGLLLNTVYFVINFGAVLLIFRRFLRQRFIGWGFGEFAQAILLGFAVYYFGTALLAKLLDVLGADLVLYNNDSVGELIISNRYVMLVISVLLAPVIEETLVRGLVFGSLLGVSSWLAYPVSCLVFMFMHCFRFFGAYPAGSVLLSCIPYIPASVALAWTYEKSGTIWAPITLHALINALSYGILTLT